jgi:sulfide:quinone oxidoreductase
MSTPHSIRPRVVIAGGGVAGIEALLALRSLLGEMAEIVIVAPQPRFVYAPMTVAEPFGAGEARSFELADIAGDQHAQLRQDGLDEVDARHRLIRTLSGEELDYDALLVAIGARRQEWLPGAQVFRGRADANALRELVAELDAREVSSVAFAAPLGHGWPLPLYELALLTAAHVADQRLAEVDLTLLTPEEAPLQIFGPSASEAVRQLLADRGINLRTASAVTRLEDERLHLARGDPVVADRVVALARLEGPAIAGLPHDPAGFIPVDAHGRVDGLDDVYAAGDGTNFPVKQGGIATQQADAAADAIAAGFGAAVEPKPFRPVLRGMLLTGLGPTYLRSDISGTAGDNSDVATDALWWPPAKIAGRHLGPYLAQRGHPPGERPPLADRAATDRPAGALAAERRAARDLALALADAEAGWGHHAEALQALETAESIEAVLPSDYVAKREQWEQTAKQSGC